MGKIGWAVVGLIVGIVLGTLGGTTLAGGAMAGAGAAAGISTGVCSTVQAAQDLGLLTGEQVDQVLNKAAENMSKGSVQSDKQIAGSAAACATFLAENAG